jgi:ABC-type glycerol-3-phosphate transport system permease component
VGTVSPQLILGCGWYAPLLTRSVNTRLGLAELEAVLSMQLASWYTAGQIFEVQVPLQEGARIDGITGINKVVHRLIL